MNFLANPAHVTGFLSWCFQGSFVLQPVLGWPKKIHSGFFPYNVTEKPKIWANLISVFHSFLLSNNIPVHGHIILYLSLHRSKGIWVASTFWLF